MKKIFLSVLSFCTLIGLLGCNAFLELEPLDKVSGEQLTETEGGLKSFVGKYIYFNAYRRFYLSS